MKTNPVFGSIRRPGFTLIELLVVVAILLVLFTMGAAFLPTLQEDLLIVNSAGQVQGALLIAKQRAKRDGRPTGVRLPIANDISAGNYDCNQLIYIQQPDDYAGGTCIGVNAVGSGSVFFSSADTDFTNGGIGVAAGQADYAPVQAGDYFEIRRGGGVAQIAGVSATSVPPAPPFPAGLGPGPALILRTALTAGMPVGGVNATRDWRIIRSPRRLQGEDPITLPEGVDILYQVPVASTRQVYRYIGSRYNLPVVNIIDPVGKPQDYYQVSQNIPVRAISSAKFYEILFSPAGNVVVGGTGAADKGYIVLWIDDKSGKAAPVLITINIRTGQIATHPALGTPNPDPFGSVKSGRSSGM